MSATTPRDADYRGDADVVDFGEYRDTERSMESPTEERPEDSAEDKWDPMEWQRGWTYDADLHATTKAVMATLACEMDDGRCAVSKPDLAEHVGCSPRTVREHITRAKEAGWVVEDGRESRGDRGGWVPVLRATRPDSGRKRASGRNETSDRGRKRASGRNEASGCSDPPSPSTPSPSPKKVSTPSKKNPNHNPDNPNPAAADSAGARNDSETQNQIDNSENHYAEDEGETPQEFLGRILKRHNLRLETGQKTTVWQRVRSHHDKKNARDYLELKIAELEGEIEKPRKLFKILVDDAKGWSAESRDPEPGTKEHMQQSFAAEVDVEANSSSDGEPFRKGGAQ